MNLSKSIFQTIKQEPVVKFGDTWFGTDGRPYIRARFHNCDVDGPCLQEDVSMLIATGASVTSVNEDVLIRLKWDLRQQFLFLHFPVPYPYKKGNALFENFLSIHPILGEMQVQHQNSVQGVIGCDVLTRVAKSGYGLAIDCGQRKITIKPNF